MRQEATNFISEKAEYHPIYFLSLGPIPFQNFIVVWHYARNSYLLLLSPFTPL
jgi:hypothetical protein